MGMHAYLLVPVQQAYIYISVWEWMHKTLRSNYVIVQVHALWRYVDCADACVVYVWMCIYVGVCARCVCVGCWFCNFSLQLTSFYIYNFFIYPYVDTCTYMAYNWYESISEEYMHITWAHHSFCDFCMIYCSLWHIVVLLVLTYSDVLFKEPFILK